MQEAEGFPFGLFAYLVSLSLGEGWGEAGVCLLPFLVPDILASSLVLLRQDVIGIIDRGRPIIDGQRSILENTCSWAECYRQQLRGNICLFHLCNLLVICW